MRIGTKIKAKTSTESDQQDDDGAGAKIRFLEMLGMFALKIARLDTPRSIVTADDGQRHGEFSRHDMTRTISHRNTSLSLGNLVFYIFL
jgi:hypothetical protein